MTDTGKDPFPDLVRSYNQSVDYRESASVSDWKKDLRWHFLAILQKENRTNLIDIGAGTGVHGLFFQSQGIEVNCIDLSPALVEQCRKKGLPSQVLSVLDLGELGRTFDSAFSLNSLLHIPSNLLPKALSNIARILGREGLFYWGQYGGEKREGIYEGDHYQPKRFFSLLEDDQIQEVASGNFMIEDFKQIRLGDDSTRHLHFQSLLLRVKPEK